MGYRPEESNIDLFLLECFGLLAGSNVEKLQRCIWITLAERVERFRQATERGGGDESDSQMSRVAAMNALRPDNCAVKIIHQRLRAFVENPAGFRQFHPPGRSGE